MFQFTTTNVVNSPWWGGYTSNDPFVLNEDKEHSLFTSEEGHLYVKGVNDFLKDNVVSIYKAEATPAEFAEIKFDFGGSWTSDLEKGDILRLNVYIGISQGSNNAMYSNDFYFKGKPLMIDFVWLGSKQATVEKLAKTIKKFGLEFEGEKMVNVTFEGNTLVLTAVNEYQRFNIHAIEKLDPKAYNGVGDWTELVTGEVVSEGKEGFGTYNWILHNLRIPTAARNDMFGQNFEETPEVGALYDQYTIHYCKNRGSLGLNAVGDQTMSHTTHVFYVKSSGCGSDISEQFTEAIKSAFNEGGDFEKEEISEPNSYPEGYESNVLKFNLGE